MQELLDWLSSKNIKINKKQLQSILEAEDQSQAESMTNKNKKPVNSRGKFDQIQISFSPTLGEFDEEKQNLEKVSRTFVKHLRVHNYAVARVNKKLSAERCA